MVSNSMALRVKIELLLPELMATGAAITSGPDVRTHYPEYLFTIHCMIRASVPLMQAALVRALALGSGDPVAAALADYLTHHIPEEKHHDDWLLDDLEELGFDRAATLQRIPSAAVAAVVGSQYYWVHHYHPVALLGYIAVLEGYPPSVEGIDDIRVRTGFPAKAFQTMVKHARLDPHHRQDLYDLLDRLALSPEQSTVIGINAMQTVTMAAAALREVLTWPDRPAATDARDSATLVPVGV